MHVKVLNKGTSITLEQKANHTDNTLPYFLSRSRDHSSQLRGVFIDLHIITLEFLMHVVDITISVLHAWGSITIILLKRNLYVSPSIDNNRVGLET